MPVKDAMERGPPQLLSLVAAGLAIVRIVKFLTIRDDDADAQAGAAGCWPVAAGAGFPPPQHTAQPGQPVACAGRLQPTKPGGGPSLANQTPVSQTHSWRAHAFTRLSMLQQLEAAVRQSGPTEA